MVKLDIASNFVFLLRHRILRNQTHGRSQRRQSDITSVHSVDENLEGVGSGLGVFMVEGLKCKSKLKS